MSARLTSRMLVSALIRRVEIAGGTAAGLAKGDEMSGSILPVCSERGRTERLLERVSDLGGSWRWADCGPQDIGNTIETDEYLARRRRNDPDLWLVELTVADAERFAAETIGAS